MLNPAWTFLTLAVGGISWALLRRRRGALAWVAPTCFVGACLLAAADPETPGGGVPDRWIVLDTSDSCAGGQGQWRRWVERAAADLPPAGRVGLILVGARPEVALPLTDPETASRGLREALARPPEGEASALGAALRLAAASGPGADVLLVSDGRASDDLEAGARAVRSAGGRLYAFAPELPLPRGAWVAALDGPSRVPRGGRAALRVALGAWTPTPCRVELGPPGGPAWRRWELSVGPEPALLEATTPPLEAPTEVELRLTVEGRDASADNQRRLRIGIEGEPRALVVGAPVALPGVDARRVAPEDLAAALEQPCELVVLADVEATRVDAAVGPLRRAVEAGTALVVLGATRAFGQGGYAGSPLEELLPLTSGPASERGDPLSAAFVVDGSGSMLQGGRFAAAVEALPWSALRAEDALATLAFADAPTPLSGWGTPHPEAAAALRAHAQRAAGGGTDVGAALLAGLTQLEPRPGARVLVLVTDSLDPDPTRHLDALTARRLDPEAWTVLLVRIGAEDDAALRRFAEALGPAARVLAVAAADAALREALAGEVSATRASLRRGAFALRPTAAGAAAGLEPAPLQAYAASRARPEARVLARVEDPELDEPPAVASWPLGSGVVCAAPLPPAAAAPALEPILGGLLPASRALELVARRGGGELRVHAVGEAPADAELVLVEDGAEASRRWPLPAGGGELLLPAPQRGCELALEVAGATLARTRVAPRAEVAHARVDSRGLAGLSARHGGRLVASLPSALPPRADGASWPLAGALAVCALAALLLDVAGGVVATRRALRRLPDVALLSR